MPFFLVTRDDNDNLRLLSSVASPSRQDALALLSSMTADAGFDAWSSDVMLVDMDRATSVLLVRPSEPANVVVPNPLGVEELLVEADTGALVEQLEATPEVQDVNERPTAPEPIVSAVPVAVPVAVPASIPVPDAQLDSDSWASVSADEVVAIPSEEAEAFASYVAPIPEDEPSTSFAILADEYDASPDPGYPVPALAMELEPEPAGLSSGDELRDALTRTAAVMEAETLARAVEEPELPEPVEETALETWPWLAEPAVTGPRAAEPAVEQNAADEPTDEPAIEPIVADEPAARPFATDGRVAEPLGVVLPPQPDLAEPALDASPMPSAGAADLADDSAGGPSGGSEFLDDLEPIPTSVEPVSASDTADAPAASWHPTERASLDGYVCDDCVYTETCPNKDQRLPKDCGSFQWK